MLSSVIFLFLFLSLPGISYPAASVTLISVFQTPEQVITLKGTDITFYCVIPLSDDNSGVEVRWWKKGENEYLKTGVDNRKRFGLKNKGGGFFALLNATFQDSGVYHCVVIRQGKIIGNGTGSNLTVCAPPTPLKIFSKTPQNNSATALNLVCESAAFYPGDLTLVWYKNGIKVATGINPKKWQNAEGLYEVSSSLEDMQPVPNGAVYICLVSHISLQVPAIVLYTVNNSGSEPCDKYYYIWGSGCAVGGLAFLVFMIIIGTRLSLKNKGKQESRTILSTHEGLGEEDKIVTYAAVDLNKANKTPGRKHEEEMTAYAQIKQGTFRDKVT